jgi:hypothetical protein
MPWVGAITHQKEVLPVCIWCIAAQALVACELIACKASRKTDVVCGDAGGGGLRGWVQHEGCMIDSALRACMLVFK